MKTGFVAVEEMPSAEIGVANRSVANLTAKEKSSALYQIAIIAAAVLLIASAAFL